jgi:hypothetical protein
MSKLLITLIALTASSASALTPLAHTKTTPRKQNIHKLRGGALDALSLTTVNLVNAIYYGGYGVPLILNHDAAFGPDGLVSYTRKPIAGTIGNFFARFTGIMFVAVSAGYLFAKDSAVLAKQFAIGSLAFIPLMTMNSQDEANFNTPMWKAQHVIHIPLAIVTAIKAFQ